MQAKTTTLAPTDAEIDAAYRKVWSTVPHAQRLSAFAHEIASTLAARWGAPAPANFPARITALLHEVKRGPWEDASGEPLQDDAAAALAWIAAPPAQEARVPLSSKECRDMLEEVDHYNFAIDLIRAVEKHHGITAAQEGPAEPDMRSVALAAGAYTTAYSMLTHAKVHNADVDGSTKRLVAAINGLRSALGPSAPVAEDAEDAARYRWLRHGDNDELVLRRFSLPSVYPLQYMLRGKALDSEIDLIRNKNVPRQHSQKEVQHDQ